MPEINTDANEGVSVPRTDDLGNGFLKKPQVPTMQEAFAQKQKETLKDAGAIADIKDVKIKTPTAIDWANMSENDVYDLDIPIQARPFDTEDSLTVVLKDPTYVARWVNKHPMRLGSMLARGFMYVTSQDLAQRLAVEVTADAEDHYIINDVVLMKITKERYYAALRAVQLRTMATLDPVGAHKAAINHATEYMNKETSGNFASEAKGKKIKFYSPEVEV